MSFKDWDTTFFQIIWFPSVLILNGWHIYIMFEWSEEWAEGSDILILVTIIHLLISFTSIYLVYHYQIYLYQWKDLRFLSLISAYGFLGLWFFGFLFEIYLIFVLNTFIGFFVAIIIGYFLTITLTLIPEALVIVVYEASLNLLDRDSQLSQAGYYFSFYEFFSELLGIYGDDMRLTHFLKTQTWYLYDILTANFQGSQVMKTVYARILQFIIFCLSLLLQHLSNNDDDG